MRLLFTMLTSFLLSSCAALYGIKERQFDKVQVNNFLLDYKYNEAFTMQDSLYSVYYYAIDKCSDSLIQKNFFQPLQAHYISKDLKLQSSLVNCYAAPGLTKLRWNAKKRLEDFPPKSHFDGSSCQEALINIAKQYPLSEQEEGYLLIFWNLYMERQSKLLINAISKNSKGKNYKLILINNDKWFQ